MCEEENDIIDFDFYTEELISPELVNLNLLDDFTLNYMKQCYRLNVPIKEKILYEKDGKMDGVGATWTKAYNEFEKGDIWK